MGAITLILLAGVLTAISVLLAPKQKIQNAEVQEGEVPTASADAPIPVIFGDVWVKASNVVWWGDPYTKPIKSDGGGK